MFFGFAVDSSDVDLLNIDLLDTHLHSLDKDIPSKHFVFLQVFLQCLQKVFNIFLLYDLFKTSWKIKNCYAEYILKTLSRHLEDQQMFAGIYHNEG